MGASGIELFEMGVKLRQVGRIWVQHATIAIFLQIQITRTVNSLEERNKCGPENFHSADFTGDFWGLGPSFGRIAKTDAGLRRALHV